MTSVKIEWDLTDPQLRILDSDKKFRIFMGGIGSGKTAVGWMSAIKFALENPKTIGVIISPTYTNLRDVILTEMDRWLPEEFIKNYSKSDKQLDLTNGSVILFRTADNPRNIERLRGMSISWWWADEITILPKLIWDVMVGRMRQPDQPHMAIMTGTPKLNWVYDTFIDETGDQYVVDDEYEVVSHVPTFSNVHLPPDYIRSLTKIYSGRFYEQEILGEFVNFEGLIYDVKPEQYLTMDQFQKLKFDKVEYGLDFGFQNQTAFIGLGVLGSRKFVFKEFYERRVEIDDLINIIKTTMDYFGYGRVWCDPSEPASIKKLRNNGINARKANNEVSGGIRIVGGEFASGNLFINRGCTNLCNELRTYAWDDSSQERPIKINDHACDGLRYVIMGLGNKKKFSSKVATRR
jgi:PBSX family phage terminase large subunit